MNEKRALILANAGLIAGLALGSIALSSAAATAMPPEPPALVRRSIPWDTAVAARGDADVDRNQDPEEGDADRGASEGSRLAEVVASLTRMDVRDVEWQLHAVSTLAQIAASKGVGSGAVVVEAGNRLAAVLDEDVASGRIDLLQKDRVVAAAADWFAARLVSAPTAAGAAA